MESRLGGRAAVTRLTSAMHNSGSGRRGSTASSVGGSSGYGGSRPRMRVAPGVFNGGGGTSSPLLPGAPPPGKQPWRCRLYGRVALCFIGASLSSSVLLAFPTLEPILLDQREGIVSAAPAIFFRIHRFSA